MTPCRGKIELRENEGQGHIEQAAEAYHLHIRLTPQVQEKLRDTAKLQNKWGNIASDSLTDVKSPFVHLGDGDYQREVA